jgi:hypothetical protein
MADILIRAGDRLPILPRQILVDDIPVDLTTASTVKFVVQDQTSVVINGDCAIVTPLTGNVEYDWSANDALLPAGIYIAHFVVTFSSGKVLTSPNTGYLTMQITSAETAEFTYSGDPERSSRDKVRFYLQDTDPTDPLLSDQEIEHLLTKWMPVWGSEVYIAAVGAEIIAGRFAREVSTSADGVSIGVQELQQKYNDLALSLRDMYKNENIAGGPDAGGMLWDEQFDPSLSPLSFWKGMHDNVRAGQQDFGGGLVPPPNPWIEGTYGR